jgi:hypothetical protein
VYKLESFQAATGEDSRGDVIIKLKLGSTFIQFAFTVLENPPPPNFNGLKEKFVLEMHVWAVSFMLICEC